eukprot:TRINITY_DN2262_c0_g1_i1.p1 TRINITY_DN2262_c0_g1~~TRINITY_DN2262_c0_g1_i1.p1  ORF type:complete len:189 (-),score=25.12 TRINITY_DN2262_c0_g1_i1:162-728(-)
MKFLICVDDSANSDHAFRVSLERYITPQDHLTVLSVAECLDDTPYGLGGTAAMAIAQQANEAILTRARAIAKKYKDYAISKGFGDVEGLVTTGNAAAEVIEACENLEPDFLIVGRRGHSPLEALFVGSCSSYAVQNAVCTCIVVHMPAPPECEECPPNTCTPASCKYNPTTTKHVGGVFGANVHVIED